MSGLRATAIVLGRGGSKGLARKNVLPVAGRACVLWTVDAALSAARIGRVAVSTDDRELMAVVRGACGDRVEIVERPGELASDTATVDSAARHAVGVLDAGEGGAGGAGGAGDVLVILYANVPVRPEGLIDRAVEELERSGADSVQSYAPVGKHHPWWTVRVEETERGRTVRPWEGEVLNHGVFRRQDLPAAYVPDGGVIAVRREALLLGLAGVAAGPHAFFGRADRRGAVITGEGEVVDIDTALDRHVAEAVLRERGARAESAAGRGTIGVGRC